jgi:hypothetical protein
VLRDAAYTRHGVAPQGVRQAGTAVYFYELHEGDGDLFHDLLLVHETEFDPETFFDMVQAIRRRVQDDFEQDTLIEAIADELEDEHGFEVVRDERLTAAVNVSHEEEDNFLAELGDGTPFGATEGFRTLYATLDPDERQ